MPDWLIGILAGAASGLLGGGIAWGVLTTRVSHLERMQLENVKREVFDIHIKSLMDGMALLRIDLRTILDRFDENSTPHRRRRDVDNG